MGRHDTTWAPSPGDVIEGRYRMRHTIDEGGMGVIFAAEHMRMRREVAIKFLHPDIGRDPRYRSRFEREVEVATSLDHANVVHCYDFGETDRGILYLVMELLDGRSLKQLVRDEGRLSTRRATDLMLQLLDGMAAAHMAGIIHRDLKPGNVFVTTDHRGRDVVKILDFGLAKSLSSDQIRLTATGSILGTASYLPPESLVIQETDEAGDVYALGLIFLELLLGRKVFGSRFMAQTFVQQLVVPARIPRRVWDTPLGGFLARCLAKHPAARPANADDAFHQLERIADRIDDFVLSSDEVPPRPDRDLDDELLAELAEGRYRNLDTLRTLPAPEPWDAEATKTHDTITQRIVIDQLRSSAELSTSAPDDTIPDEKPTTPRLPNVEEHGHQSLPTVPSPDLGATRPDRGPLPSDLIETRERIPVVAPASPTAHSEPDQPSASTDTSQAAPAVEEQPEASPMPVGAAEVETEEETDWGGILMMMGGVAVLIASLVAAYVVLTGGDPPPEAESDEPRDSLAVTAPSVDEPPSGDEVLADEPEDIEPVDDAPLAAQADPRPAEPESEDTDDEDARPGAVHETTEAAETGRERRASSRRTEVAPLEEPAAAKPDDTRAAADESALTGSRPPPENDEKPAKFAPEPRRWAPDDEKKSADSTRDLDATVEDLLGRSSGRKRKKTKSSGDDDRDKKADEILERHLRLPD